MQSTGLPAPVGRSAAAVNPDPDQRIIVNGVEWWQYETILAALGERPGVRVAYLEGQLELRSPSRTHEYMKKLLARLLEAYADERGLVLDGYGSMTMKNPQLARGAEPDECYAVGTPKDHPDIAIEVVWTSGGIEKLEIYRGLDVREVWMYEDGRLSFHALRAGAYVEIPRSELIPAFERAPVEAALAAGGSQSEVVRAFRSRLRGSSGASEP